MKTTLRFTSLLAAVAVFCGGATAAQAQSIKVGVVDMNKVFSGYYKTKDAENKINDAREVAKKELDDRMESHKQLLDEINQLNKDIDNNALSASAKSDRQKKREDKINQVRSLEQEITEFKQSREKQLQEQAVRMRNQIVEEIMTIINAKVKSDNYDLVFDKSGQSLNGVQIVPALQRQDGVQRRRDHRAQQDPSRHRCHCPGRSRGLAATLIAVANFSLSTFTKRRRRVHPPRRETRPSFVPDRAGSFFSMLTVGELVGTLGGELLAVAGGNPSFRGELADGRRRGGIVLLRQSEVPGRVATVAGVGGAGAARLPAAGGPAADAGAGRGGEPLARVRPAVGALRALPAPDAPGIAPTAVLGRDVRLGAGVSIQPYAVIEDGVEIGDGVFVGAHGFIGAGSVVGAGTRIYPHVTIRERSRLGRAVIVHSGTVIGSDGFGFEIQGGRHVKIPQTGIVQIDDDVEIGANCAMTARGLAARTSARARRSITSCRSRTTWSSARIASWCRRWGFPAAPGWGNT